MGTTVEEGSEKVWSALARVMDPDLHKDIVSLGMVRTVSVSGSRVSLKVALTTPACPLKDVIERDIRTAVLALPGFDQVEVEWDKEAIRPAGVPGRAEVPGVANIVAVSAAKGGVGKTTMAVNLALALRLLGARVGILDADVYGPNVPIMLGTTDEPTVASSGKMEPIVAHGLKVVSFGTLVRENQPIIWRGPMLAKALREFLYEVEWGELDYLIVDLPPGTGDVQLTLAQSVPLSGVVVVTTPEAVSVADVRRGIQMFVQLNVPVVGIVENMSGFVCGHCGETTELFGHGGGALLAQEFGIPLLGQLPLDPSVRMGNGDGIPLLVGDQEGPLARAILGVAEQTVSAVARQAFDTTPTPAMPGPRVPAS